MKSRWFMFLIALFGVGPGCSPKPVQKGNGKHPLRTCLFMDPATLDPRKNGDVYSSTINFLLYEGLTRIRPDGSTDLALAQSVDVSEDGKTYTFHLRDAIWSDGHPITADDFEYSWKKILDPRFASPCPHLFFAIKNAELAAGGDVELSEVAIRALDEKTLQVELENPTPYFLSLISFCNFYPIPKHIEAVNPFWQNINHKGLVSSGPFELVDWTHNREIKLKKSPSYWDKEHVYLDAIDLAIIPEQKTALNLFETGELDFVTTLTMPLNTDDLLYWQKKGHLLSAPVAGTAFCTFNMERFPFHNLNIRKALSLAINRDAILRHISPFANRVATRCIPPNLLPHTQKALFPDFSPELARAYLKKGLQELGIDLATFEKACVLSFDNSEDRKKIAQVIQQQWKEVFGIHITLQTLDMKSHMHRLLSRNYSIAIAQYIAQYNDANNILERFKHKATQKNLPGFENAEYARLLDEAASMTSVSHREALLAQAEESFSAEVPLVPLHHFSQHVLVNEDYTNLEFSPIGNLLYKNVRPQ